MVSLYWNVDLCFKDEVGHEDFQSQFYMTMDFPRIHGFNPALKKAPAKPGTATCATPRTGHEIECRIQDGYLATFIIMDSHLLGKSI